MNLSSDRQSFRPRVESLEERCLLSSSNFMDQPVVPVIDFVTQSHLQGIYLQGLQQGNRPDVFAKVGDSNTWSPNFLSPIGTPGYDPLNPALVGQHTDLASTVDFFRSLPVDATGANSFTRVSAGAYPGYGTPQVLDAVTQPLLTELDTSKPAFALIMVGTWDVTWGSTPDAFRTGLMTIAGLTMANGVIPVLTTFPNILLPGAPSPAAQATFNQVVADVASTLDIPLVNLWRALEPLPNYGLSADLIHPLAYPFGAGVFTDDALQFGFNTRNLIALETLDKLRQLVIDNGTPDTPTDPLSPSVVQYVTGLYQTILNREPDGVGLNYFGRLLQHNLPRQDIVSILWRSAEHRGLQVDQFYNTYLHHTPDAAGRAFWVGVFLRGASEVDMQRGILSSPEYLQLQSGSVSLLTALYHDVLASAPDTGGQTYWTSLLQGGTPPANVVQGFLTSDNENRQVIDDFYQNYLHRPVDTTAQLFWLSALDNGLISQEQFAGALLVSDEFWAAQMHS